MEGVVEPPIPGIPGIPLMPLGFSKPASGLLLSISNIGVVSRCDREWSKLVVLGLRIKCCQIEG